MIDLTQYSLAIVTDPFTQLMPDLHVWLAGRQKDGVSSEIFFDTEFSPEHYPNNKLAGIILYWKGAQAAYYIPANHGAYSYATGGFLREFLTLLSTYGATLVTHHGVEDLLILHREVYLGGEGMPYFQVHDTGIIATLLQFRNHGLKDLSVQLAAVDVGQDITYEALSQAIDPMATHRNAANTLDLTKVQYGPNGFEGIERPEVLISYLKQDVIGLSEVYDILVNQFRFTIGEHADEILNVNGDTLLLLARSGADGYITDLDMLRGFIKQFTTDVNELEESLLNQMREAMGWPIPGKDPAPTLANTKTAEGLPSLFG